MKIKFENFVKAGSGTIELNDLTIICGPNNTGKTYLNYAIFSILEKIQPYFDIELSRATVSDLCKLFKSNGRCVLDISDKNSDLPKIIAKIERKIKKEMHESFNLSNDFFSSSKYSLEFENLEKNFNKPFDQTFTIFGDKIYAKYENSKKSYLVYFSEYNVNGDSNRNFDWIMNNPHIFKSMINVFVFNIIFRNTIPTPFPVTSERTGISLFHTLHEIKNAEIVDIAKQFEKAENVSLFQKSLPSYALPIQKNIESIRLFEDDFKRKSFITRNPKKFKDLLDVHSELLEGGRFSLNGGIFMYHPDKPDTTNPSIPLYAASSSLKSLFLFDIFIKHLATEEHILIIDEPELNLYPVNQALMARLVARLVNAGVKVLISTHSDYFIRELNNSVMLKCANRFKDEVMQKYGYCDNDILDYNRINAYTTTKNKEILEVTVNNFGIDSDLLDKIIIEENNKTRDVRLIMDLENED